MYLSPSDRNRNCIENEMKKMKYSKEPKSIKTILYHNLKRNHMLAFLIQKSFFALKTGCIIIWSVFVTTSVLAQDELAKKSTQELITLIKNSQEQEATVLEKALLNLQPSKANQINNFLELGSHFYSQGKYKRSLHYINKVTILAQTLEDDALLGKAYLMQGNSYLLDWQNHRALDAYHKVLTYTEKTQNIEKNVIAKINIGIINRRMNQLNKSVETCLNALEVLNETSLIHTKNHVNLLTILSDSYLDLGEYNKALEHAENGVTISNAIEYHKGLVDLYTKIGFVYCKKEDHALGAEYMKKAHELIQAKTIAASYFMDNIHYFSAVCYYDQGLYQEATIPLIALIQSSSKEKGREKYRTIEAHRLLAESYKQLGDAHNSAILYDTYVALNEEFLEKKDAIVNKIYEKDTQQLGVEIQLLKEEYLVQRKKHIYLWLIGSFVILILSSLLYMYFRRRQKDKQRTIIKEGNAPEPSFSFDKNIATIKPVAKEIVISNSKIKEVLQKLDKLENQEYFLSIGCNLRAMAKKVKTNATYLSVIINNYKGKNFINYINDLRINYAVERLKQDKKFRSFSIKSIAEEVGYKSDYSFAKHFKSKTGLNPSDYIKTLGQRESLINT